jgi:hypothetical protein
MASKLNEAVHAAMAILALRLSLLADSPFPTMTLEPATTQKTELDVTYRFAITPLETAE